MPRAFASANIFLLLTFFPIWASSQTTDMAAHALAVYKSADYETAIPLLRASAAQAPKDSALQAALLAALVYQGAIDEASDLDEANAAAFPQSAEVAAARGEFAFYTGDMGAAEKLFRRALQLDEKSARAAFGLSRLYRAASFYRRARLLCLSAHEGDPDDALVTRAWLNYAGPERRNELLPAFAATHPWLYKYWDANRQTEDAFDSRVKQRQEFELDGDRQETSLHLLTLLDGPRRLEGFGLDVSINGGRPLHLLLDTGAHGILLNQTAIDKAGLEHLGSGKVNGAGDKGPRGVFFAVADTCQIGSLKFKLCAFVATEGKRRVTGDLDGLIGADVFSDYLLEIDFQRLRLHLKPLAVRPASMQGYDREIPADEADFAPVFRFGHMLMVPTRMNKAATGLFLLDTGAMSANVDSTFARRSTKISGNSSVRISGVSGEVKDVFEANKAEFEFAHFRQNHLGMTAFNLNNSPDHHDVRMAGVFGLPVLMLFRLTLDYRNGLVKFDYVQR